MDDVYTREAVEQIIDGIRKSGVCNGSPVKKVTATIAENLYAPARTRRSEYVVFVYTEKETLQLRYALRS